MCQFGDESHILEELDLEQSEALRGYRSWHLINSFNDKEKFLRSLHQDFLWPKKEVCLGNPTRNNSKGIYNYNYNYNNYNNNYNNYNNNYNNYYNYNYNNNYNNYYNYNYNNYNYYNNYYYYYNNYNLAGTTLLFGKVFRSKNGYRSSHAIPIELVTLQDERWFKDDKTAKFAEHFNKAVESIAKEYNCKTIGYNDWLKK